MIAAALLSMAQATATKPATKPTTIPATATRPQPLTKVPPMKSSMVNEPLVCPDIEAIIKSIPEDMWPKENLSGDSLIAQSKRFKEWSDKNVAGKVIDFSAIRSKMVQRTEGSKRISIGYPWTGKEKTTIEFAVNTDTGETKRKCGGIMVVFNNGAHLIEITVP